MPGSAPANITKSVPILIPSPRSACQQPSNDEQLIDKFATLFSPATPPASPTFPPTSHSNRPPADSLAHSRGPEHSTHSDADAAYGSFVSVPASHDPLSHIPPLIPDAPRKSPSVNSRDLTSSQTQISLTDMHGQNASWNFFDKFTEDAKRASEKNKRGVLDELLLHEDDPLYWLKKEAASSQNEYANGESPALPLESGDRDKGGSPPEDVEPKPDATAPLIDLQFDDLTTEDEAPAEIRDARRPPPRPSSAPFYNSREELYRFPASLSPRPHRLPSSISTPNTPIPSGSRSSTPPVGLSTSQRGNHNSLTNLSSRLMSSLLSSSQPSPAITTPTAHTVFANRSPPSGSKTSKRSYPTAQSSLPNIGPNPYPHLHHPQTLPPSMISISHGTPFASQSYTPPSGAPGFAGDDHAWDKGFSKDYDKEKVEKRSVLFKGRKDGDSYVHVLGVELADMIRPHLPALSRLPRTWTLLYSVDQHGISLNTLYSRCEAQRSKVGIGGSGGVLVVVKDSGDALFGVWMGEGIMLSKGAYYGSGESFLWKYIGGQLDVFKWTGRNDYVALCEPEYISFGGGDGSYGLYLDETLLEGSSARCPTFGNEPLCSPGPKKGGAVAFECVGLEVWGIGS